VKDFAFVVTSSFSDVPTKKGHLMILVDATQDVWERRWFVLRR
jgi:kinesin family protein 1